MDATLIVNIALHTITELTPCNPSLSLILSLSKGEPRTYLGATLFPHPCRFPCGQRRSGRARISRLWR
ncbi:hypothetical protein FHW17_001788 [Phyllobacterium sp. P30BS-XVII]|nr:hypothetical protein [Phyllobacterium sp. P30BS-XVII]